jgi:hypothetical protein
VSPCTVYVVAVDSTLSTVVHGPPAIDDSIT